MIGKCRAIAHGSNALEYIFREGKLGKTLLFHNLCRTTPKEIYEEMKIVNDYNTRCRNKFLRIENTKKQRPILRENRPSNKYRRFAMPYLKNTKAQASRGTPCSSTTLTRVV